MKLFCVTYKSMWEMWGRSYEMYYPAMNEDDAKKMCEKDFKWAIVTNVECMGNIM